MALDLSALRRIIADENRLLTGADIPAEYQSDVLGASTAAPRRSPSPYPPRK